LKEVRVLQIIDSLNTGGAEVLAINIANYLASLGIHSHLCITRVEGDLLPMVSANVNYLFLNKKKTLDFRAFNTLRKYIAKHKINVIHAHSTSYFVGSCMKLLFPKIKLFWHDHFGNSEFLTPKSRLAVRRMSFLFDGVIVVNKKLLAWNENYLSAKHYYKLNNFAEFMNDDRKTELKGIAGKRIVHVASFIEQKDHLNLLRSFKKVRQQSPEWTLHLIGKGLQDEYHQSILEYISKNQLSEAVIIYGVRTDIKNILSQSTIGVLSSKSEGLPVSLLEFGLRKLPVVVTNVGDCGNLIEDETALVAPENSDELANALMTFICNEEKRRKSAQQLHDKVVKEYSIDNFINTLVDIYRA
jgi:glycosyltransferase involved in cell wall biosynthesis